MKFSVFLLLTTTFFNAAAQTIPDAGSLRPPTGPVQELPTPQAPKPALPAAAPIGQVPGGVSITVRRFVFEGNTVLEPSVLEEAVASYIGQSLNFSQLEAAVADVASAYRSAGWVVRAYLPRQEVDQGVVTIQVVESIFGKVVFEGPPPQRISQEQVQRIIYAQQAPGTALRQDRLDRGYLIASDLSAVQLRAAMKEGDAAQTTDVVIELLDKPFYGISINADNTGPISTGQYRASVNADLRSLAGMGDLLTSSLAHTQGSDSLGLTYQVPVGSAGWRVGINTSKFQYQLISADLSALQAKGSSDSAGLDASYPLVRALQRNLYLSLNAQGKTFDNQSNTVVTTRYRIDTVSLGLNGNAFDSWGGAGLSTGGLSLVGGRLNLQGSPNQGDDLKTTQTDGEFWKMRVNASRQQTLAGQTALYVAYLGQVANKNLDSSEKLYLGGANGVRAYPSNEAGGSQGQLINLELRTQWPNNLSLSGFYDWGQVLVNRNNNYPGASANNELTLQGAGLALAWQPNAKVNLKATWARRIGQNPAPTATGADQDGTLQMDRFWFTASLSL